MRDLTPVELQAVGGGRAAPAPAPARPRLDFSRVVALFVAIFGRPRAPASQA
jgi:hypothetical protein